MSVGRWFDDNLVRVWNDGTRTFFMIGKVDGWGALCDRFRQSNNCVR